MKTYGPVEFARRGVHDLLSLDCLICALNQVIATTEIVHMPEDQRRKLMQQAIDKISERGIARNNCDIIDDCYRIATKAIGDENPYREIKLFYDREIFKLLPELREHIKKSDDPLRSALRLAIAGNLIDLAANGHEVSLESVLEKIKYVDREGFYTDESDSLAEALSGAKTLLVLGDNCGEIAMDKLLIETIRELYPQVSVQYGVRGYPTVNDVTREDAEVVGMEEVAEVIDNGDNHLSTLLHRTSYAFNRAFYEADVVIAKGMGNYEGLNTCNRGNIWFCLVAKCNTIARLTDSKKGAILCIER